MTKQIQDAYIVAAKRTPITKAPKGSFKHLRPDDLLVHAIAAAMAQVPGLDPKAIEDAIIGCAIPEAQQGLNVARMAALLAGLPETVGGVTVNRFCASGLTAIAMAADRIRVGESDVLLAGGTESMSMVPMMGNSPSINPAVFNGDNNVGIAYGMGLTAENVATQWKISRQAQDEFALASHQKALAAQQAGEFNDEMVSVEVSDRTANLDSGELSLKTRTVSQDEGPRAASSIEGLAKLRPAFASPKTTGGKSTGMGSVTAGNSSQTSDGAGALILASEKAVKEYGLTPLARFVGFQVRGVPPEVMGIGPKEAIPAVLSRAGLKLADMGWIELNEAFAAQALAVMQELDMNADVVNPMGGAIALGHPLGATGAIRAASAIYGMRRRKEKYSMVSMCIGTGMGAAGVFEAV